MKKAIYVIKVVLPLTGLATLFSACASTPCNNDACYDRTISSVDPYEEGEIAAWGTEKQQKKKEKQLRREFDR